MITYCTNIHPGESWGDIFANLQEFLPPVKSAVSPDEPFPVGLRLSSRAALDLTGYKLQAFTDWLQENGLFVPTINGFPYGEFHSARVKEQVYLPDWRDPARVAYTVRLATLLDCWLPEGVPGSVSTVPLAFKSGFGPAEMSLVKQNLVNVLQHLDSLRQKSGREIVLSLEPEPGCLLETTDEVVRFFEQLALPDELRQGLGICLDCCHQALQFETPEVVLSRLADAGVRIGKVQISSAPRLINPAKSALARFQEDRYLHQTIIRHTGTAQLSRYDDLPDALQHHQSGGDEEWRIHFHLPVFLGDAGWCGSTRNFIEELVPLLDRRLLLEIETYTWDVLPDELRSCGLTDSIVREINWLKAKRDESYRRS